MFLVICVAIFATICIDRAIRQSRKFKKIGSKIILDYKDGIKSWVEEVERAGTDDELIRLSRKPVVEINVRGLKYEFRSRMQKFVGPHARKIENQPRYLDAKKKTEGAQRRHKQQRGLRLYQESQTKKDLVDKLVGLLWSWRCPLKSSPMLRLPRLKCDFRSCKFMHRCFAKLGGAIVGLF